jgi:hypothetical protein
MKTIALAVTTLTIAALSSPIVLDAQRGGGGRGGPVLSGPRTMPSRDGGAGRVANGRVGDGRGNPMSGRGSSINVHGNAINVRVRPAPLPVSPGGSIDHPLPRNLNSVNPAPVPGFGRTPSPFGVGPGYYNRQHPSIPYGIPYGYGYGAPDYEDASVTPPPPPQEEMTLLFLDVTPSTAMVFADTGFVGSIFDLRTGLRLSPGHHWIDLEATGYEKKTFEVTAVPGQPVRYQTELTPVRTAALVPVAPHPPQTMYAIPGCYGGNTPPVAANLPKGCDIAKVRVLRPPQ